jgi:drug/metabolite transporter (DMT)-like permease
MHDRGREHAGVALCLLSAAGFGALSIFAKLAYRAGVGVIPLLTVRFALAAAALWALWRLRGGALPQARRLAAGFGLGLVGYSLESGLFFAALTRLHGLARVVASLRLPLARGRGRAATRPRAGADPLAMAGAVTTGAAVAFAAVGLVSGRLAVDFSAAGWGWVAAIALVSTVVAIAAFLAGLARVGPGRAAILSTIEPPLTVLLAFLAFGESLRPVQLLGGALVLAAVLVLQVLSRIREPSPRPAPPPSARPVPSHAA